MNPDSKLLDDEWEYDGELKSCFNKEMVEYNFQIINNNDPVNEHCNWIGQYTIGNINYRGTQLWLRTNVATSFDSDMSNEEKKGFYDALEKPKRFPGDCCNLRSDSLEDIINGLESKTEDEFRYYNGTFEELMKILWKTNINLASNIQHAGFNRRNTDILCDLEVDLDANLDDQEYLDAIADDNSGMIWIIKQNMKEKIIKELKQVLKICNKHNVSWV